MKQETFKIVVRAFFPSIQFHDYEHITAVKFRKVSETPTVSDTINTLYITKWDDEYWSMNGNFTVDSDFERYHPLHYLETEADLVNHLRFYHDGGWVAVNC